MGSLVASSFAAPVAEADADAQVLLGHHGLVGGVYSSAPAATVALNAAPVAAYHAVATPAVHVAAPAVAEVKTVEVKAAPAVVPAATYAYAAPIAHHVVAAAPAEVKTVEVKAAPAVAAAVVPAAYHAVAAPAVHVATAPVVQHVGYQVHHVPQVHVQKHTSTHTTHHVINHAPVVGAFIGGVAPVKVAAEVAPAEDAAVVEEA